MTSSIEVSIGDEEGGAAMALLSLSRSTARELVRSALLTSLDSVQFVSLAKMVGIASAESCSCVCVCACVCEVSSECATMVSALGVAVTAGSSEMKIQTVTELAMAAQCWPRAVSAHPGLISALLVPVTCFVDGDRDGKGNDKDKDNDKDKELAEVCLSVLLILAKSSRRARAGMTATTGLVATVARAARSERVLIGVLGLEVLVCLAHADRGRVDTRNPFINSTQAENVGGGIKVKVEDQDQDEDEDVIFLEDDDEYDDEYNGYFGAFGFGDGAGDGAKDWESDWESEYVVRGDEKVQAVATCAVAMCAEPMCTSPTCSGARAEACAAAVAARQALCVPSVLDAMMRALICGHDARAKQGTRLLLALAKCASNVTQLCHTPNLVRTTAHLATEPDCDEELRVTATAALTELQRGGGGSAMCAGLLPVLARQAARVAASPRLLDVVLHLANAQQLTDTARAWSMRVLVEVCNSPSTTLADRLLPTALARFAAASNERPIAMQLMHSLVKHTLNQSQVVGMLHAVLFATDVGLNGEVDPQLEYDGVKLLALLANSSHHLTHVCAFACIVVDRVLRGNRDLVCTHVLQIIVNLSRALPANAHFLCTSTQLLATLADVVRNKPAARETSLLAVVWLASHNHQAVFNTPGMLDAILRCDTESTAARERALHTLRHWRNVNGTARLHEVTRFAIAALDTCYQTPWSLLLGLTEAIQDDKILLPEVLTAIQNVIVQGDAVRTLTARLTTNIIINIPPNIINIPPTTTIPTTTANVAGAATANVAGAGAGGDKKRARETTSSGV